MNNDKLLEKLNDKKYVESILSEINHNIKEIHFILNHKPEAYVRERKGKGKHFYNPKSEMMNEYRKELIHNMNKEDYDFTRKIIEDENATYVIELEIKYFIQVPTSVSIKKAVAMLNNKISPAIRPDLDNYNKFLLDTLHGVIYDDDKRVVKSSESKLYSLEPRTEIIARIIYNQ